MVSAHLLAMEKAPAIGFARYIISATTPFSQDDLLELRSDATAVLRRRIPDIAKGELIPLLTDYSWGQENAYAIHQPVIYRIG